MTDAAVRTHLADAIVWGDAHVTLEKALAGLPPRLRGAVPDGVSHSPWQILEHIRIAQADILEFCIARKYQPKKWPGDYWPRSPRPKNGAEWRRSIAAFQRDRQRLQQLAVRQRDLAARVPAGSGQSYLREILLVIDHTAYHVGEMVVVRRALGAWPDQP